MIIIIIVEHHQWGKGTITTLWEWSMADHGDLANKMTSFEMLMIRYSLRVCLKEHRTNEDIAKEANVIPMMRRKRMKWYEMFIAVRVMKTRACETQIDGKTPRGRLKKR